MYFGSQFKGTVHHGKAEDVTELDSWSIASTVRKQTEPKAGVQLAFSTLRQSRVPAQGIAQASLPQLLYPR